MSSASYKVDSVKSPMHSSNQFAATKAPEAGTKLSFPNLHSVGNKVFRSEVFSLWREFNSFLGVKAFVDGTSKSKESRYTDQ